MPHTVAIAALDTKPHNRCFEDFARALTAALNDLGEDKGMSAGRLIILGANDPESKATYPDDAIFFNAEQVATSADPLQLVSPLTRDRTIWDYSRANIARWRGLGFKAVYCPVGYHRSMESPACSTPGTRDVDVLHYGHMTPRRMEVVKTLQRAGLAVMHLNGVYGEERDSWIARSKVVLNVHHKLPAIFEIFRCSHLFANRKCVVSEWGGFDPDLEALAQRACIRVPIEKIVEACQLAAVGTDQGMIGYEEFKKIDLVDGVRRALVETAGLA